MQASRMNIDLVNCHPLRGIFDDRWTPSDDIQLVTLRDDGVRLDRISQGLGRDPSDVQARWHRLRVVPSVRSLLAQFQEISRDYPAVNPTDLMAERGGHAA
jgi:hypothetical protein